jgi:hypothetical protein
MAKFHTHQPYHYQASIFYIPSGLTMKPVEGRTWPGSSCATLYGDNMVRLGCQDFCSTAVLRWIATAAVVLLQGPHRDRFPTPFNTFICSARYLFKGVPLLCQWSCVAFGLPLTRRHFPADDCKFALKSGAECWMEHTETTTTLTRKPKPKFWLHATMLIETVEVDGHFFSSVWHFCFCRLAGAFGGFRCFWASIRGVRWVKQPLPVILATRDDVTLSSTTPVKVAGTGGWLAGQKLADSAILEVYFVEVRTHPWQYHVIHTRCRTDDCEHCAKVSGRYNSFL